MAARGGASWIESANDPDGGFPLDGLPYCIFTTEDRRIARPGVGIGRFILDLERASRSGLLEACLPPSTPPASARTLNKLMACEPTALAALRARLQHLLHSKADQATRDAVGVLLSPMREATLLKPVDPPNFTDFYASIDHATNVGRSSAPTSRCCPTTNSFPSAITAALRRSWSAEPRCVAHAGKSNPPRAALPGFGPSRFLDYEVEVGLYIGEGNALGEPIEISRAGEHIFGVSLVNDWSARDMQPWEYQPLGPFLAKSFATSVSPWVVPMAALKPFRVPASLRAAGDPDPLDYLWDAEDQHSGAIDLIVEALLADPSHARSRQPNRTGSAAPTSAICIGLPRS